MIYLILLVLGIILLTISLVILQRSIAFVKDAERAIGRVTQLAERTDPEGTFYQPIFEFKTSDNRKIEYTHYVSSSPPSWQIGEEVTFIFDPATPESAKLLTYSIFGWTMALMGVAVTFIVTGVVYCLFHGYLH